MSNLSETRHQILTLINQELRADFEDPLSAVRALETRYQETPMGFCGTHCNVQCQGCTQALENLSAFFTVGAVETPASDDEDDTDSQFSASDDETEIQQMAYAGDDREQDRAMQRARVLDEVEDIHRTDYAFDYGCNCDHCSCQDDGDWGDGGLDWNESGYFD